MYTPPTPYLPDRKHYAGGANSRACEHLFANSYGGQFRAYWKEDLDGACCTWFRNRHRHRYVLDLLHHQSLTPSVGACLPAAEQTCNELLLTETLEMVGMACEETEEERGRDG